MHKENHRILKEVPKDIISCLIFLLLPGFIEDKKAGLEGKKKKKKNQKKTPFPLVHPGGHRHIGCDGATALKNSFSNCMLSLSAWTFIQAGRLSRIMSSKYW